MNRLELIKNALAIGNHQYANKVLTVLEQENHPEVHLLREAYDELVGDVYWESGELLKAFSIYQNKSQQQSKQFLGYDHGVIENHTTRSLSYNPAFLFDYKKHGFEDDKYWNGQDLTGKTLLILTEAGYGDEIIFLSFIRPLLEQNCKIVVLCSEGLQSIVERSFSIETSSVSNVKPHDYWIDIFKLPVILGISKPDITPYICSSPNLAYYYDLSPLNSLKIGLRWHGDTPKAVIKPLSYLVDAFKPFGSLISLHKEVSDPHRHTIETTTEVLEYDYPSWEHTLAMIDQMDYIITNETSISVMSAAMGKPTIVIAPKPPYICWASHIPWFKDVHVFSKNDEKWEGAIDAAADYLRNRIERDI